MTQTNALQSLDASTLDADCARAMQLQLAGQLDLAGQIYRTILQAEPQHAAANHCLGMLHVQAQRPAEGLPNLIAALQAKPEMSEYWLGLLEALTLADQLDAARNTLAVGRQHGLAGASVEDFANRLQARLGREAAVETPATAPPPADRAEPARPAKARRPRGRVEDLSVRKQESALQALVKQRNFSAAFELARGMVERFPKRGLAWKIVGAFPPANGNYDEAIVALQTAVGLLPRDAEAHVNLGLTLAKAKRFPEAEFHLHKALELKPGFAAAHYRLAVAYELQGRFADAEASLRRGIALRTGYIEGDEELSHSHLLFLMSHNPAIGADALFAEHRRYGEYLEERVRDPWPTHTNSRDPARRIKVGFVSGDLCRHAVASFIEPILTQFKDRSDLELHAYYTNTSHDEFSQRLLGNFKTWNVVCALSDLELANVITKDGIDILIDLSGHTGLNRLPAFARKPAPIQASWIGYPGTTGLRAMDYYLAGRHFLPPGQFDAHFTEKLVYLPANVPFQPHPTAPPINRLPALETGRFTFGSFNRIGKINDSTVGLWSQLLRALPEAKMLIAGMPPGGQLTNLIGQFAAGGIALDRLTFHERGGMETYLALHHQVDMCLDTTPYTGGTTTIHALWMGIPTLTVAGPTPAARSGAAFLGDADLFEFVATDAVDFVAKGLYWATHLEELAAVRAGLRGRLQSSPIPHAELIGAAFVYALRRMWRRWCAALPAESFEITTADLPSRESHERN
ncbi:MAG TPA: tetratricopeptide repeat protein [Steroidobacteraceae bacterium]|nr:tetratricopeptide repeat protein [Steroidobacteraceae bacterium]